MLVHVILYYTYGIVYYTYYLYIYIYIYIYIIYILYYDSPPLYIIYNIY